MVHTLEAVLWCFFTIENYRDCVLKALNLGSDTDTVACVAESIAGLLYGETPIEWDWTKDLRNKRLLESVIENFVSAIVEESRFFCSVLLFALCVC